MAADWVSLPCEQQPCRGEVQAAGLGTEVETLSLHAGLTFYATEHRPLKVNKIKIEKMNNRCNKQTDRWTFHGFNRKS